MVDEERRGGRETIDQRIKQFLWFSVFIWTRGSTTSRLPLRRTLVLSLILFSIVQLNPITMNKPFSWKARSASFSYAFRGIVALFRSEHNAWIHGGLTAFALLLSILLPISKTELILILIAITLVWVTEIINTAIEKTMDFISKEKHPQIGLVKDLAAAAVLVSAVAALVIGTIIFLPKILHYV